MEFQEHSLPNGIRIVHKTTPNGQVGHFGLTINAGSRDEREDQQGLAHFIEHSLFKGTRKRKAYHILNRMDSVGAELNAFTTKEETVIYASFLKNHLQRAVEVIADIALNSTFPEKEMDKEREVIIDEINSYLDSPAELIFDDFEEHLFGSHPLGRNILGTEETVRRFGRSDISEFMTRRYKPEEMVVSSVGPYPIEKVVKWVRDHFGAMRPSGEAHGRLPAPAAAVGRRELDMDTFQAHLLVGGEAYPAHHSLRFATILLNNHLGGPTMNSRLSLNIREKHGIAYNIESSYHPYADTGVFTIYLGTDKKTLEKSEKLIHRELTQLRDVRLTPTALHRAKQQLIGQFALSREGAMNTMLSIGKSLLAHGTVRTTDEILRAIDAVTDSDLLEVANEIFDPSRLSTLVYK